MRVERKRATWGRLNASWPRLEQREREGGLRRKRETEEERLREFV